MAKKAKRQPYKKPQQATPQKPVSTDSVVTSEAVSPTAETHLPVVTIDDVKNSATESEFAAKKETLINQLDEEISMYQGMVDDEKAKAEQAAADAESARTALADVNAQLEPARAELDALLRQQREAEAARDKAASEVESVKTKVEQEAERITAEAQKKAERQVAEATADAAKTRDQAKAKAREALRELSDSLAKQGEDLETREEQLQADRAKLKKEQKLLKLDREGFQGEQEALQRQRELYTTANPAYCEQLKRELDGKVAAYDQLLADYNSLRSQFVTLQVQVDEIRTEVQEPDGSRRIYSMKELLERIRQLTSQLEVQRDLLDDYPDIESVRQLQSQAALCNKLEGQLRDAEHDRDTFRDQAMAERRLNSELAAARRELDATHALKEHLLNELEKNKKALENRNGNICPALTKVDDETEDGSDCQKHWTEHRRRPSIKSLKDLVELVYSYAGNGNAGERLYYTRNDIRAFLAGMAVSRLIMLEGMSGTGKSSLPRIFSKAISGDHHLIPVESSWRDRNELLGYYNDFNKLFNAKTFTIELYRSGKAPDIPTFIVLDEMNLARIEYYFSDFLAILQEPDQKKWLIDLVSTDMRTLPTELSSDVEKKLRAVSTTAFEIWRKKQQERQGDLKVSLSEQEEKALFEQLARLGALIGAKDLVDGRQIRVAPNIWFVGTANQDESTFEVSDKVYDRAQVISLNKKGKAEGPYDPKAQPGFISVELLLQLFEGAGEGQRKQVEERLEAIDTVLMQYFDLSFGNRIVTQTIKFAAVYVAAGGSLNDALDAQISTKIVRKVLTSDNSEGFMALEDACKGYEKTLQLIQKRLNELN